MLQGSKKFLVSHSTLTQHPLVSTSEENIPFFLYKLPNLWHPVTVAEKDGDWEEQLLRPRVLTGPSLNTGCSRRGKWGLIRTPCPLWHMPSV